MNVQKNHGRRVGADASADLLVSPFEDREPLRADFIPANASTCSLRLYGSSRSFRIRFPRRTMFPSNSRQPQAMGDAGGRLEGGGHLALGLGHRPDPTEWPGPRSRIAAANGRRGANEARTQAIRAHVAQTTGNPPSPEPPEGHRPSLGQFFRMLSRERFLYARIRMGRGQTGALLTVAPAALQNREAEMCRTFAAEVFF